MQNSQTIFDWAKNWNLITLDRYLKHIKNLWCMYLSFLRNLIFWMSRNLQGSRKEIGCQLRMIIMNPLLILPHFAPTDVDETSTWKTKYNGLIFSPLIIGVYMIKYGSVTKYDVPVILKSKNSDVLISIDDYPDLLC